MRVIAKRTLRDFWIKHADAEQSLKSWYQEITNAEWASFNELKMDYPNASIVNGKRVVFNIKGNRYRLVAKFNFDYRLCFIRFVGTHAEYDKIDVTTI